jgi:hypothetical protein
VLICAVAFLCATAGDALACETVPSGPPISSGCVIDVSETGSGVQTFNPDGSATVSGSVSGLVNGTFRGSLGYDIQACARPGFFPNPAMGFAHGTITLHDTAHNDGFDIVVQDNPPECTEFGVSTVTNGTGRFLGITPRQPPGLISFCGVNPDVSSPFHFTTGRECSLQTGLAVLPPPCTVSFVGCSSTVTLVSGGAIVGATLVRSEPVGILVQRVVGKRLVRVGRVPFGRHHKGRLRIHWHLKVNGHKLPKGRYQITLRALDNHGNVVARAKPVRITIH